MKKLTSPFSATEPIIADGRTLYDGKGTCMNCHGRRGKGDGPVGAVLDPPRDLTNCEFQKRRSDGELFWIIKHGSPGTATFVSLPKFANALDDISLKKEVHLNFDDLRYIDHACLNLLNSWKKFPETQDEKVSVDWKKLEAKQLEQQTDSV